MLVAIRISEDVQHILDFLLHHTLILGVEVALSHDGRQHGENGVSAGASDGDLLTERGDDAGGCEGVRGEERGAEA